MNYRIILKIAGRVAGIEAVLMLLPAAVALVYGESIKGFALAILTAAVIAVLTEMFFKPKKTNMYAREGFVSVALSWVLMSAIGALPFVVEGEIPGYIDALFEIVSGFTTTGASILTDIETMSRGLLFWRSFTHWIGGMGVLVFMMAVLPLSEEHSMHIMRAEVPGPSVGKLVPKMRRTSMILYLIYAAMTIIEVIMLLFGGMPLFDSLIHAFGSAGTGGFSIKNLSVGYYNSAYIEIVIGVFIMMFGINFNLYYLLLIKKIKAVIRNEELLCYLGIIIFAAITIALNIKSIYGGFLLSLRHSFFQVSSIITTTGFSSVNFHLWPEYSRAVLVALMFIGACAGSTGGGIKISRIVILARTAAAEIRHLVKPHSYNNVTLNGEVVDAQTVHGTLVFFMLYLVITILTSIAISYQNMDLITTFTSVVACISNVGPGLGIVGPYGNYSMHSDLSKILLTLCMLIGRLEIYPMLMLFSPAVWRKRS
jgi:trk system potassium uptake protein TrkH